MSGPGRVYPVFNEGDVVETAPGGGIRLKAEGDEARRVASMLRRALGYARSLSVRLEGTPAHGMPLAAVREALTPVQQQMQSQAHNFLVRSGGLVSLGRVSGQAVAGELTEQEREAVLVLLAQIESSDSLRTLATALGGGPVEHLPVPESLITPGIVCVAVDGNCMAPDVLDGDYVIVDTQRPPVDGSIVTAVHDDGRRWIKWLFRIRGVDCLCPSPAGTGTRGAALIPLAPHWRITGTVTYIIRRAPLLQASPVP